MDEQKLKIFNAMASFVQDLNVSFGKRFKPIALYNRLMEKTTLRDSAAVERHIQAFTQFFNNNPEYVSEKKLSDNALIVYTHERIFIDVNKVVKSDADTQKAIHQHLTVIYSLMNLGTKQGKEALEKLKQTQNETDFDIGDLNVPDTNEGKFLKKTLGKMTEQFKNMDSENANPMTLMTSMLKSGFLTDFVGTLQSEFQSGQMNMGSLINTVTSVMGQTANTGSGSAGPDLSQLTGLLANTMTQMGSATGNSSGTPDIGQLTGLLSTTMSQLGGSAGGADIGQMLSTTMSQLGGGNGDRLPDIGQLTGLLSQMGTEKDSSLSISQLEEK